MATLNAEKTVVEYFTVDRKGNANKGAGWQADSNDADDSESAY
jgi:hypothetical protein